jgi:hypothetical protein
MRDLPLIPEQAFDSMPAHHNETRQNWQGKSRKTVMGDR